MLGDAASVQPASKQRAVATRKRRWGIDIGREYPAASRCHKPWRAKGDDTPTKTARQETPPSASVRDTPHPFRGPPLLAQQLANARLALRERWQRSRLPVQLGPSRHLV
jgi:hypothetical protein